MHIEEQLALAADDDRSQLLARAVDNNENRPRRLPWEKPQNKAAIAFLNSKFTLEQRVAKFREEALESTLEVTRELDNPGSVNAGGLRGDTLSELADVIVTLDALLSRPDCSVHLLAATERAYARLRGRIAGGEFGPPPEP